MNKNSKNKASLKVPFRGFRGVFFLFFGLLACNPPTPIDNPEADLSMYITCVFEYVYAPGQHARGINSEREKRNFIGRPTADTHLGGWGGFIVAGFNHDVPNIAGKFDFEIFSNGIAPEPAIVYVMSDENGDGLPNGTWYELRGSEFRNPRTIRNYKLTYFRAVSDTANITWRDNQGNGNTGELISRSGGRFSADWWWSETTADSITFVGTRLPDAYINIGENTQHWIVPDSLFTWGYAENNQGTDYCRTNQSNKFDISNAVDADGNPVHLEHIRFIKIYTAVFQQAGWLNEISAEVRGARNLHHPSLSEQACVTCRPPN